MESLKESLFEDPFYLYVTLAFVELALVGLWHARRTRRRLIWLAGPVLLAAGVFVTEKLVVTDREQIRRAMIQIARHVEAADLDALREYLDEDLTGAYGDRDQAVQAGRRILKIYRVKSVRYLNPRLTIGDDRAEVRVTTVVDFESTGSAGRTALKWRFGWRKRGERWRIREVDRPERGVDLQSP